MVEKYCGRVLLRFKLLRIHLPFETKKTKVSRIALPARGVALQDYFMKRFVASAGLVVLGTSALYSAPMAGLGPDDPKPWSVSATLRSFYDDNINTTATDKVGAFGVEISPTLGLNFSLQQTSIRLGYTYSFKDYDHRPGGNTSHYDQSHLFNFALDHAFSERYQIGVRDSFVIGQEPDTLRAGNTPLSSFQRIPGDNIRNYGSITFNAQLTPLFGLEVGYANSYFDYKDEGAIVNPGPMTIDDGGAPVSVVNAVSPSLSGVLDRMENVVHLDTRWTVVPTTTFIVGGQARQVEYTADELISGATDAGDGTTVIIPYAKSGSRDFREYSGYVGAEHSFLPNLSASGKVGASYVEYYHNSLGNGDGWSPFARGSLRWTYSQENTIELGISHDLNATDIVGASSRRATLSAESTIVYANLSHHITPFLIATATGQFQNSSFNGGDFDGKSDRFYLAGISLEYKFTPHLSAQAGYNYDRLESEIAGRGFDRNRVYIGVTAGY